jgi:hypothetical protein
MNKDEILLYLQTARESDDDALEAIAQNICDDIDACHSLAIERADDEGYRRGVSRRRADSIVGSGKRPSHPPLLMTDFDHPGERFTATLVTSGLVLYAILAPPIELLFTLNRWDPHDFVGLGAAVAIWPAVVLGVLFGMWAAR